MSSMNHCARLDDYLDDELTPEESSRFLEHAEVCSECRANLDAMSEFSDLVAESKIAFDDWYAANSEFGQRNIRPATTVMFPQRSAASRLIASVAVVAATIAIMFLARTIVNQRPNSPNTPIVPEIVVSPNGDSTKIVELTKASIRMPDGSGYLAEPIETSNPNMTIYWLHPTVDSVVANDEVDSSSVLNQDTDLLARKML